MEKSKIDSAKQPIIEPSNNTALKLDFFDVLPDKIDGCGEYFTYDTTRVAKDKYIFLSNLTEFAIIKINGKDIFLKRDTTENKVINDKSYITFYKGQGYKAVLSVKQTQAYDEGGFYSGTLQIIIGNKEATFNVHGEAGC